MNNETLQRIQQQAFDNNLPYSCMVELVDTCNLNCIMCAFTRNKKSSGSVNVLSRKVWLDLFIELKAAGVLCLTLTGGEPTTHPEFETIYKALYSMGFIITLKTNGTCFTSRIKQLFSISPPHCIMFTIYGASSSTYEEVTGRANSFNRFLDAYVFALSIKTHVEVNFTVIKQNIHDLHKVMSIVNEHGIRLGIISDIHPHVDKTVKTEAINCRLEPYQRVCLDHFTGNDVSLLLENSEMLRAFSSTKRHIPDVNSKTTSNRCSFSNCIDAKIGCYITCCGTMTFCAQNRIREEYPTRDGFLSSWNKLHSQMYKYFPVPKECETCNVKSYCKNNCPSRFSLESGSLLKPSKYTCDYAMYNSLYNSFEKSRFFKT